MKDRKFTSNKWIKISRGNFKPASIGISCPRCFDGYVEQGSIDFMKRQYVHKTEEITVSIFRCPSCGYSKWKAIECTGDRAVKMMSKSADEAKVS